MREYGPESVPAMNSNESIARKGKNSDDRPLPKHAVQRSTYTFGKGKPLLTRGKSMTIPGKPRKQTKQNIVLSMLQENQYEAMMKMSSLLTEKEAEIKELETELKTMKMLSLRQEKALAVTSKDLEDTPKFVNQMQADLKLLKLEKQKLQEKLGQMEKSNKSRIEELLKLQFVNEKLRKQLETMSPREDSQDKTQLLRENDELTRKIQEMEKNRLLELKEKNQETKELRQKYHTCHAELLQLRSRQDETLKKLTERERQLAAVEVQLCIKKTREDYRKSPETIPTRAPISVQPKSASTIQEIVDQVNQNSANGNAVLVQDSIYKPKLKSQIPTTTTTDNSIKQVTSFEFYVPSYTKNDYYVPSYEKALKQEEKSLFDD